MDSSVLENMYLTLYDFVSGMHLTCISLCCEKALAFCISQFSGGSTLLCIGTMFMKWITVAGICGRNWVETLPCNSVLSPAFWVTLGKSFTLFMPEFLFSDTWKILFLNYKKLSKKLDMQRQINNCITSLACGIFNKKIIDTENKLVVARGGGWGVREMGEDGQKVNKCD